MADARRGAQWALIDQAIVSAANFLTGLLVARSLGAAELAAYSLAFTAINGISSVHRALISQPMNILGARESVEARHARYAGLMSLQTWLLPACLPLMGAVGAVYFPDPALVLGAMFFLLVFCLQDMARRFHYTGGEVRGAVPLDAIAFGGQLLALAAGWALGHITAQTVMWWMGMPLLVAFWIGHQGIRRAAAACHASHAPVPERLLSTHWEQSRWIVLSIVLFTAASQLVPFQIASFGDRVDVANYHAANVLMNALNVIRFTVGNYLPGKAAMVLAEQGLPGLKQYMRRLSVAYVLLAGVAYAGFEVLGAWLIDLLFKGQYPGAGELIGSMAAIHLLAMSTIIATAAAQVLGETRVIFYANVAATVAGWALGPWLITQFGIWGGLGSLAIGLLLPALIQCIQVIRLLNRPAPLSV